MPFGNAKITFEGYPGRSCLNRVRLFLTISGDGDGGEGSSTVRELLLGSGRVGGGETREGREKDGGLHSDEYVGTRLYRDNLIDRSQCSWCSRVRFVSRVAGRIEGKRN